MEVAFIEKDLSNTHTHTGTHTIVHSSHACVHRAAPPNTSSTAMSSAVAINALMDVLASCSMEVEKLKERASASPEEIPVSYAVSV